MNSLPPESQEQLDRIEERLDRIEQTLAKLANRSLPDRDDNQPPQWLWLCDALKYAGVDKRTFKNWMRDGLPYSRLPSNRVKVNRTAVDEYIGQFSDHNDGVDIDSIVADVMKGLKL